MKSKFKLPYGTQDYKGLECYNKLSVENKLHNEFALRGYRRIETPTIEYLDMFTSKDAGEDITNIFTVTDTDGSILALRKDMTIPIARAIMSKEDEFISPIRLCYSADSFARYGSYLKTRQYAQCGIELIGSLNILADVEVISLAISCLKSLKIHNFKIEIGQVNFLKGILDNLDITEDIKKELILLISQKNRLAIELLVEEKKLENDIAELLSSLPYLFGGREVIDEGFKLIERLKANSKSEFNDKTSANALKNLLEALSVLDHLNLSEYICIDLANANEMNYYSGIIFKAVTSFCGSPLLSGGRYSSIFKAYNKDIDATGFALGIKNILITLDRMGILEKEKKSDYVIGYEKDEYKTACTKISELINKNKSVINSFINNEDEFFEIAEKYNAYIALFIKKNGKIIEKIYKNN